MFNKYKIKAIPKRHIFQHKGRGWGNLVEGTPERKVVEELSIVLFSRGEQERQIQSMCFLAETTMTTILKKFVNGRHSFPHTPAVDQTLAFLISANNLTVRGNIIHLTPHPCKNGCNFCRMPIYQQKYQRQEQFL